MLKVASLEPRHETKMTAFLQSPARFLGAKSVSFRQSSMGEAPASGEIYGILSQMLESFENALASAQKEERTGQSDYNSLKSAKIKQIEAEIKLIEKRVKQIADRGMKLQTDKRDNTDTSDARSP